MTAGPKHFLKICGSERRLGDPKDVRPQVGELLGDKRVGALNERDHRHQRRHAGGQAENRQEGS